MEATLMIIPTKGRIVWFHRWHPVTGHNEELAAIVCKVHSATSINVTVFDEDGTTRAEHGVFLVPDDADPGALEGKNFCRWMPYQVGQAKKYEALKEATDSTPPTKGEGEAMPAASTAEPLAEPPPTTELPATNV
jgi:hypothetical protein